MSEPGKPEWVVIARAVSDLGSHCQMTVSFDEPPSDEARGAVTEACVGYFMKCFPDATFKTATAVLPYIEGDVGDLDDPPGGP